MCLLSSYDLLCHYICPTATARTMRDNYDQYSLSYDDDQCPQRSTITPWQIPAVLG